MRLRRLEAMQAALTPRNRKAVAGSRPLFGEIETTAQSSAVLRTRSRALAKAARELVQTVG